MNFYINMKQYLLQYKRYLRFCLISHIHRYDEYFICFFIFFCSNQVVVFIIYFCIRISILYFIHRVDLVKVEWILHVINIKQCIKINRALLVIIREQNDFVLLFTYICKIYKNKMIRNVFILETRTYGLDSFECIPFRKIKVWYVNILNQTRLKI